MSWTPMLRFLLDVYDDSHTYDSAFMDEFLGRHGPFGGLLLFPGLRQIDVTFQFWNKNEAKTYLTLEDPLDSCRRYIVKFFLEKHKAVFGGGVPLINISFSKTLFREGHRGEY